MVTFRMDLQPLQEKQYFSPLEDDRLFVRGSFNDWSGTAWELRPGSQEGLYTGTFLLDAAMGDTVEFKYIIQKNNKRFYWETEPDPANPHHGNRRIRITRDSMMLPVDTFHYDEYFHFPVIFTPLKLRADFVQMRRILEETHPALYDYTGKGQLDSIFQNCYARLDNTLDFNTFYSILSEAVSKVGCGHTSLWVPSEFWNVAPERLFPVKLHWTKPNLWVEGWYGEQQDMPLGSEILTINGDPVRDVIRRLQWLTSADGFNQAYRSSMVEKHFSMKYALHFGFPEAFRVQFRPPGQDRTAECLLRPVSMETIDGETRGGDELSFRELEGGKVALMTIGTFAYYDQVEMFQSFIDSAFQAMHHKGITTLVLDLRGNSGGDPFCSSYLFSCLAHEPVPYFAHHYGRYDTLANPVPLAPHHFQGDLYTLIDGNGFSTTGHFCALLKYHQIGKFAGSETGATYTCTGSVSYMGLDHTGIILGTARNQRYSVAVQPMDRSRGVIPDYPVEQSQQDIINNRDAVLDFVLSLVNDPP